MTSDGGLRQIFLVSLSHPERCQGDRETCPPSQRDRLNWKEAETGDPHTNSWVI